MTHIVCDGNFMYADKQVTTMATISRGEVRGGVTGTVRVATNELVKILVNRNRKPLTYQGVKVLAVGSAGSLAVIKHFDKWWRTWGGDLETLFNVAQGFDLAFIKSNGFLFMLADGRTVQAELDRGGKLKLLVMENGTVATIGAPSTLMRYLRLRQEEPATALELFITGTHGCKGCSNNFDYYSRSTGKLNLNNILSLRQIEQIVNRFQSKVTLFRKDMNKQHNKFED